MYRHLLLLFMLLASIKAGAKYEQLLHKTYAERRLTIEKSIMDKIMLHDTANAGIEISALQQTAIKGIDKELQFEAKLLRVWNAVIGHPAAVQKNIYTNQLLLLLNQANRSGYSLLEIDIENKLGYYYFNIAQQYDSAFNYYLDMYGKLKEVSLRDMPQKYDLIYNIADAYYHFGDQDNAYIFLHVIDQALKTNELSTWCTINTFNTIGLIYRNTGSYDTAMYYFRQAAAFSAKCNIPTWVSLAEGNIGTTYFLQKDYAAAAPLLQKDVEASITSGSADNATSSILKLTEIRLQQNDIAAARSLLARADTFFKRTNKPYMYRPDYYRLLSRALYEAADYRQAYLYADTARIAKDTLDARMSAAILLRNENKVQAAIHIADVQKMRSETAVLNLSRNYLVVAVTLLAIIILLLINRQKIRKRELHAERQHALDELHAAELQLAEFKRSIQEKNLLIEKISEETERMRIVLPASETPPIDNSILTQLQESVLLTDEQWNQFKINFEKVHAGFLTELKIKLPDLTPSEVRFVVLSKLKLSNKEMAGMLGVSLQAVRNYKYRLRKKLNLSEEGEIDDVIDMV